MTRKNIILWSLLCYLLTGEFWWFFWRVEPIEAQSLPLITTSNGPPTRGCGANQINVDYTTGAIYTCLSGIFTPSVAGGPFVGPRPWIDVTAAGYSADPAGLIDATTAFTTANTNCAGGTVFVPVGVYKLSAITFSTACSFYGLGNAHAALVSLTASSTVAAGTGLTNGWIKIAGSHITFQGIAFNGNIAGGATGNCVNLTGAITDIVLQQFQIINCDNDPLLIAAASGGTGPTRVKVKDFYIVGQAMHGASGPGCIVAQQTLVDITFDDFIIDCTLGAQNGMAGMNLQSSGKTTSFNGIKIQNGTIYAPINASASVWGIQAGGFNAYTTRNFVMDHVVTKYTGTAPGAGCWSLFGMLAPVVSNSVCDMGNNSVGYTGLEDNGNTAGSFTNLSFLVENPVSASAISVIQGNGSTYSGLNIKGFGETGGGSQPAAAVVMGSIGAAFTQSLNNANAALTESGNTVTVSTGATLSSNWQPGITANLTGVNSQTITGGSSTATTTTINIAATADYIVNGRITVSGVTPAGFNVTNAPITAVVANTSVTYSSTANPGAWGSGGTSYALGNYNIAGLILDTNYVRTFTSISAASSQITGGSSNASTITLNVTTTANFVANGLITVTGVSPSGFNVTNATIASIVANTSITYNSTNNPGAWVSGGVASTGGSFSMYNPTSGLTSYGQANLASAAVNSQNNDNTWTAFNITLPCLGTLVSNRYAFLFRSSTAATFISRNRVAEGTIVGCGNGAAGDTGFSFQGTATEDSNVISRVSFTNLSVGINCANANEINTQIADPLFVNVATPFSGCPQNTNEQIRFTLPNIAPVTIGSGTSIGSTALCAAAACPPGTYKVDVYVDITTACTTTGTYKVNLVYTDDQAQKTAIVNIQGAGATPATGILDLSVVTQYGQASQTINVTSGGINYSTNAGACGTGGPMIGNLYFVVNKIR